MYKVAIDAVQPGMKVAKAIYTSDGHTLLNAGVIIKPRFIQHLKALGIPAVYIENYLTADIFVDDVIEDVTRIEANKAVKEFFIDTKNVHAGRAVMSTRKLKNAVNDIIDDLLNQRQLMINLQDIRSMDDYTFGHSVNVCVLAVITGIALNFSRNQLFHLGIGALMHDIGKLEIPLEILNKTTRLTDEEFALIKEHPHKGFEMLRRQNEISLLSSHIALEHHEKYDGTGYPNGLQAKDIHLFARIAGVVDVFDAVTADRVYRKAYLPHEAYELLAGSGGGHFDYDIVRIFLHHVAAYPVGTWVQINSGEIGVVVGTKSGFSTRPTVRVVYDEELQLLNTPYDLELAREMRLLITRVIPLDELETIVGKEAAKIKNMVK